MRAQLWPGCEFRYQVSLLGILLLPYAYYRFILAFGGEKNGISGRIYLAVMLICFWLNAQFGVFLAYYATALAKALGMNEDMIEIIRQAALLHDIGKIGIPESVLNKAGSLTDEEYEMIKGHVEASIDIIRHLPSLDYVIPSVIGHHERYDGKGYPRRIAGEDIPLTARILCVADSFDAMTSVRCYKKAFPVKVAREKLIQDAGKQFDPELVRKFVECLDNGKITLVKEEE